MAKKLKSLSEWGVIGAAKAGAKAAGGYAAKQAAKVVLKAPTIARIGALEGAKGVAVETGFEASKDYREKEKIKDERAALRYERAKLRADIKAEKKHTTESLIHVTPPVVLVLKRKSIRLFPQGEKIALYRNDKLGVNFAVPYDDEKLSKDDDTTIGAAITAEGFGSNIGAKILGGMAKKGWIGAPLRPEEIKSLKGRPAISTDTKAQFKAAIGTIGGAVGAGYVANKFAKKLRAKAEKPNEKTIDGAPVYESEANTIMRPRPTISYYRASGRQFAKLGAVAGLSFAAGKTAWDVAADSIRAKKNKKSQVKEGLASKLAIGAGVEMAAIPTLRLAKKVSDFASDSRKKTSDTVNRIGNAITGNTNEEREDIQEFIPLVAAAAARVVPVVARAGAAVASSWARTPAVAKSVGSFVAGQAVIGGASGAVEAGLKKAPVARTPSQSQSPPQNTAPTSTTTNTNNDDDNNGSVSEARLRPITITQRNKSHVDYWRKEVGKGAAIALGTVAVQKLFDVGYDKWKENKENERVRNQKVSVKEGIGSTIASGARAIATKYPISTQLGMAVGSDVAVGAASSHIATKNAIAATNKNQANQAAPAANTAPTNESVYHTTAFETLKHVAAGNHGKVRHENGRSTHVDAYTANAILKVHKHLSTENKAKLEQMVNSNQAGLTKIADFSFRQINR